MKKVLLIVAGLLALSVAIPVGCGMLNTVTKVATAPSRVINETMNTNNIINNYEWFHDAHATYRARLSQIAQFKSFLNENVDQAEKARLRIDLAGIQQSCRDISAKYNANATKSNRSIFMGREAPERLVESACE